MRWGSYLCSFCHRNIKLIEHPICPVCQRQAFGGKTHPGCAGKYRLDGLIVACRYNGIVAKAIKKVKYKWVFDIEKVLVDLLVENFYKVDVAENLVVVCVPLHTSRKKWRGFNQSELIARDLAKRFKVPFENLLIRSKKTQTQVGLTRYDRKINVRDAFDVSVGKKVSGRNFLLVDDVYTSGATMGECCRVLKKAGAKQVWGCAIALG